MNEHLKEFNGKQATFHIEAQNGIHTINIEQKGFIVWPFAVHEMIVPIGPMAANGFVLTHLPTGLFVRNVDSVSQGIALAEKFLDSFELSELENLIERDSQAESYDKMKTVIRDFESQ